MWFVTDPEELRNYQYSSSLKKAKADLVRRYEGLDGSGPYGLWPVLRDSLWYTGISSDPVSSLAAHGVDVSQTDRFVCWVIPVKFARELKAQALSLGQFRHAADDASDYIAPELPYTYLYNFLVEKGSVLSICSDGFSPMKYLPGRPAQVFVWRGDGSRVSWDIPTKDRDSYPEVLGDLLERRGPGRWSGCCSGARGPPSSSATFGRVAGTFTSTPGPPKAATFTGICRRRGRRGTGRRCTASCWIFSGPTRRRGGPSGGISERRWSRTICGLKTG